MLGVVHTPPSLPKDKGRIYFYRLAKVWGAALRPKIRLNGETIGRPLGGRFFFKDVDPGTYEIAIRTEALRKVVLTISAGQTQYVRMSVGFGWLIGRFRLEPVDSETGETETRGLTFAGE
jgi:hypothetical protein